jgi:broad specificity phosphatase PhoE
MEQEGALEIQRCLLLVRHSIPLVQPSVSSREWQLSPDGQKRCVALAHRLARYAPLHLVASAEAKAIETARLVAEQMGKPFAVAEGLHEHDRSNVGYLGNEEWDSAIRRLFAEPNRLVLGRETATEAHQRFATAIKRVQEESTDGTLVVFSHGTVISLFAAHLMASDAFDLWSRLKMPAFVVIGLPHWRVEAVITEVM